MECQKPVLIPAAVPWSVSTSAPYLTLHQIEGGKPDHITFIGYFKLNAGMKDSTDSAVQIVDDPGRFRLDSSANDAAYRLVRISFDRGIVSRKCPAVSDVEVIAEAEFDWREVPGSLRVGENALENMTRTDRYWNETGFSPDPGFYEVKDSPWLIELGVEDPELHHYIALGQDEYFEVVAGGWSWEAGQRA